MSEEQNRADSLHNSYHHFSLTFSPLEVSSRFADVRVVLVAGCALRAEAQVCYLAKNLFNRTCPYFCKLSINEEQTQTTEEETDSLSRVSTYEAVHKPERLTKPESRFILFKLGPVLVGNHGMGGASMSIALHELFLMCRSAGVLDKITIIRFGTCGGIGVEPGTLCITNKALDSLFQDFIELKICMKLVRRPCVIDQTTAKLLEKLALESSNKELLGDYKVRSGATVATNDFYEEQGRTNGAICEHTREDALNFLERARELGVINSEMESSYMAAMCNKLGVSFGVVCVSLANRLASDKVDLTRADLTLFEQRLFWLNLLLVRHKLSAQISQQNDKIINGQTN